MMTCRVWITAALLLGLTPMAGAQHRPNEPALAGAPGIETPTGERLSSRELARWLHQVAGKPPKPGASPVSGGYTGNDTCQWANDGECDDPGIGTAPANRAPIIPTAGGSWKAWKTIPAAGPMTASATSPASAPAPALRRQTSTIAATSSICASATTVAKPLSTASATSRRSATAPVKPAPTVPTATGATAAGYQRPLFRP